MSKIRGNGLLAYPLTTVQNLCKFAKAAFANYVLSAVRAGRIPNEPDLVEQATKDKKAYPQVVTPGQVGTIKVSFADLPDSYPRQEMEALYPYLSVQVGGTPPAGVPASALGVFRWKPARQKGKPRENNIYIGTYSFTAPRGKAAQQYQKIQAQLCTTLRHEVQHFVQMALNDVLVDKGVILGRKHGRQRSTPPSTVEAGIPVEYYSPEANKARLSAASLVQSMGVNTPFDQYQAAKYDLYVLTPSEFFPWISDYRAALSREADPATGRIDPKIIDTGRGKSGPLQEAHFLERLKALVPSIYRRAYIELRSFVENWNADAVERARRKRFMATPSRIVDSVIKSLELTDPEIARYARQHRSEYVEYARSQMPK
jgi:hypothetical protein